jgi:hypothetical protein
MASAQNRQQMTKLVSVADARTRRALAAVAIAQQRLAAAGQELEHRGAELLKAQQDIVLAERDIRRDPANEQQRVWLSHCQTKCEMAEVARDDAKGLWEAARDHLAYAQKACQRQQVRQDHVEVAAQRLKQDAMREMERRVEDDQQGSGGPTPVANIL